VVVNDWISRVVNVADCLESNLRPTDFSIGCAMSDGEFCRPMISKPDAAKAVGLVVYSI
jgi:hypothetical protein